MALSRADIQRAFQNSLGRGVSEADENYFLAQQQAGQTDAQIYASISNSTEANLITDPVVRLYQSAFGRVPDKAGLDFFQDFVRDNGPSPQTYDALARLFTGSAEYTARYGSGTGIDAAYVQALYTNILGRQASDAEVNGWVSGAYGATDRASLLNAVSQSQEGSARSDAAVNAFLLDTAEGDANYTGSLPGVAAAPEPAPAPAPAPTPTPVPVNNAPVAVSDTLAAIAEDSAPRVITATELLGNDTDADANTLRIASVTARTGGTVILNQDGTVTFTPTADFNGSASFAYTVTDGSLSSDAAIASFAITAVNDAPTAVNDSYGTSEDGTLTVQTPGLLANDTDVDGDALTIGSFTQPQNGTVVLNPDGSFTYNPNQNFFGSDTFTYTATDGNASSNAASVTVTVESVNDAPEVTSAATASVRENTTGTVYTVTASDVDSLQESLTYAISGGADASLFNINATTGAISFKVAPNFEAPADAGSNNVYDLFVTASDGSATSAQRSVAVTVTNSLEEGRILFVSDSNTDTNIPTALTARGYTVDVVTNNYDSNTQSTPALQNTNLLQYEAVYWSATGRGDGNVNSGSEMYTNLTNYVRNGGYVFVTGYDSIASPDDPALISFLGGESSEDNNIDGPVVNNFNALSFGVVDIRGVTPTGGYGDQDTLVIGNGPARPVVGDVNGAGWSLRSVGAGQIAYVSNGSYTGVDNVDWTNTSPDGAGAYNAALVNFAYNAVQDIPFLASDPDNIWPLGPAPICSRGGGASDLTSGSRNATWLGGSATSRLMWR